LEEEKNMCGINGYMQFNNKLNTDKIFNIITTMNDKITHRGPDEDGIFIKENVGLGMRRLAIIDLFTGKQPVYNEDETMVIVFNGEIYNYKELKQDLIAKGHIFNTTSDTEVVIHCFEEYGVKSFSKLKGMFSFAIYNLVKNKLIIARDRAGEKPLYYYYDSGILLFASELKSIISSGFLKKNICKRAINQYLQLRYIPAPLTIFEKVYKLLPGHFLEVDCDGSINIEEYWNVSYNDKELIEDYNQCKIKLRSTLFNSVEQCMVSDVPIGGFLSGGIDSTVIVGIMSTISKKPINTFTIGYKDKQYDESKRAQATADFHNTNHHIYYLNYNDVIPELNKMTDNIDEPFADASLIPTYMVSKYAKQFVKTVLTGDAGDELFGGYTKYLIGYYANKYNKIPRWMRKNIISRIIYSLPENTNIMRKMRKVINNSDKDIFDQRRNLMCLGFKKEELTYLLKNHLQESDSTRFIYDYYTQQQETEEELSRVLYTDFKVVLEGDMLPKLDRASMLCSLETRVPMLHKDVIELAAQIPSKYKINSKNTKIILKETFKDLIPKNLINATKRGFGVPIGRWLKNELKEELLISLNEAWIEEQGIFNYSYIKRILDEHFSLARDRSNELWTLYVFQKWYKNFYLQP
jgi:asparagine synthase (glutamine-hydrolysing)